MDNKILLESGTNEFEMLTFRVDGKIYGVNVSKVKEIIKYQTITPIPNADSKILGITMPRDEMISCVDLRMCLFNKPSEPDPSNLLIICHFNGKSTAFQVDAVEEIKRYSWNSINPIEEVLKNDDSLITGIIKTDKGIVGILDFEKIMVDINVENGLTIRDVENINPALIEQNKERKVSILLAEDSKMLNALITESIKKVGYEVDSYFDGESALRALLQAYENDEKKYDVIISDIEMPRMDGLAFCKNAKTNPLIKNIPFIIFSSLVDNSMKKKCEGIGADACLNKPQIGEVIDTINSFLS